MRTAWAAWLLATVLAVPAWAANHALLVGVGSYPALPERRLLGPANDVRLMADSLQALGWPPAQLRVLADQGDGLPTRANILQALARLADVSRRGDWVLLYFSGHGAQVPAPGGGVDEVFLARDASAWQPREAGLPGALRDKELRQALQRIRAQGAHVWAVFDTCHAADMLRGRLLPWRYLSAAELKLPLPGLQLAYRSPAPLRQTQPPKGGLGHYIGFFAAGRDEGTLEEALPDPDQPGRMSAFGVFTWELVRALRAGDATDFAALAARVQAAYQARPFPTPEFVGDLALPLPRR
jgi:uncharacterized caspase-like protein